MVDCSTGRGGRLLALEDARAGYSITSSAGAGGREREPVVGHGLDHVVLGLDHVVLGADARVARPVYDRPFAESEPHRHGKAVSLPEALPGALPDGRSSHGIGVPEVRPDDAQSRHQRDFHPDDWQVARELGKRERRG